MPARAEPAEQQIGDGTQHSAQHQHPHDTHAQRQCTADKSADQGHDDTIDFGHRSHLVFAKAHVHIERVGHDAHHHIANAVAGDQAQYQRGLPAIALEKIRKRRNQRSLQPLADALARRDRRCHRFSRQKHCQHTGQHAEPHDQIGYLPRPMLVGSCRTRYRSRHFSPRCDPQSTGTGPDHGQSITGLVGSRQCRLVLHIGRFDTESIERNILRGRCKSHRHRTPHYGSQGHLRIGHRHAHEGHHDDDL